MEKDIYLIRKTVQHIAQLMETLVSQQGQHRARCRAVDLPGHSVEKQCPEGGYAENDLMTIKEAMAFIPVSRTKLYEMRKDGMLQTIERNSRQKRLLRSEVEAARTWSRNKGKW